MVKPEALIVGGILASAILAGCSPAPEIQGPIPELLKVRWVGETTSKLVETVGTADAHSSEKLTWMVGGCSLEVEWKPGSWTVVDLSVTGSTCEINRPWVDSMADRGWIRERSLEGLAGERLRYFNAYRFGTEAQYVPSLEYDDFQVAFVALFSDNDPTNVRYFALFVPGWVESFWIGNTAPPEEGALVIPDTETAVGEARLLIEDEDLFVLRAQKELAYNVPTASVLILSVPLEEMASTATAIAAGMRLPSGAEFNLSPEMLSRIRNLLVLTGLPAWAMEFAEETGGRSQ